jgi:hypothetical protein
MVLASLMPSAVYVLIERQQSVQEEGDIPTAMPLMTIPIASARFYTHRQPQSLPYLLYPNSTERTLLNHTPTIAKLGIYSSPAPHPIHTL